MSRSSTLKSYLKKLSPDETIDTLYSLKYDGSMPNLENLDWEVIKNNNMDLTEQVVRIIPEEYRKIYQYKYKEWYTNDVYFSDQKLPDLNKVSAEIFIKLIKENRYILLSKRVLTDFLDELPYIEDKEVLKNIIDKIGIGEFPRELSKTYAEAVIDLVLEGKLYIKDFDYSFAKFIDKIKIEWIVPLLKADEDIIYKYSLYNKDLKKIERALGKPLDYSRFDLNLRIIKPTASFIKWLCNNVSIRTIAAKANYKILRGAILYQLKHKRSINSLVANYIPFANHAKKHRIFFLRYFNKIYKVTYKDEWIRNKLAKLKGTKTLQDNII